MAKRRHYPSDLKAKVVLEIISGVRTVDEVCKEYNVPSRSVLRWRAQFMRDAPMVFEQQVDRNDKEHRIAELERLAGRLALELEGAKKASNILEVQLRKGER